jgi:nicotinamidase-related amidase
VKGPALIVIDMVNDFLANWPEGVKTRILAATNDLVRLMRQGDYPIIWVWQEFEPDLRDAFPEMISKDIRITMRGTGGCQVVSSLDVIPSDAVVVKKRYSAFFGTGLDQTLLGLKPDGLVMAGINTHACVRMTAIDAYQRDWKVIIAAECVDSYDREHQEISLKYFQDRIASVMTNEEIRKLLAGMVDAL